MARKIILGADPEFGLLDRSGKVIEAASIIRDINNLKPFGVDGNNALIELRPKPSSNPLQIVCEIRELLHKGAKDYPVLTHLNWKAGSMIKDLSTGGHIHFSGLPFSIDESSLLMSEYYYDSKDGYELSKNDKRVINFVRALDTYLGQITLLIERPKEAKDRRLYCEYGKLGDCRKQRWGLEYRVTGSWMTSPAVAAGVLCLAKVVAHEAAFNDLGKYIRFDIEPRKEQFENADYHYHKKLFKRLWRRICKMELYSKYKKYINFLRRLISNEKNWHTTYSMKTAWRLPSAQKGVMPLVVNGDNLLVKFKGRWEECFVEYPERTKFRVKGHYFMFKDYKKTWKRLGDK